MKKFYCYFSIVALVLASNQLSFAQLVPPSVFLQGHWLEFGIAANGSCGPGPAPAGYHPYTGTNLAMVYDYGHDGWTTGTPPAFGDYTYPGTPFEGWAMQANGSRSDAFYTVGGSTGTSFWNASAGVSSLSGSVISYSNVGGIATGVWQGATTGSSGGLSIRQTYRLDTNASWLVNTVVLKNTSVSAIPGVYYWRTFDPDNDETYSGNFETNNYVTYQNDIDHRVMVGSYGTVYTNAYLALATKDCRAKSFIYTSWASYPAEVAGNNLDLIWNGTATSLGTTWYNLHDLTVAQDIAIGLIYNIGTIAAGDSAILSYAYVFTDSFGIDSAFPEPKLVVNGVGINPSGPAPMPTYDTFNACLYPGMTTLPVSILNASDKCWSWSSWSWAPSTGLATTTGLTNTVDLTVVPGYITYTITGTDSAIDMHSCNHRVMYLTVHTCNSIWATCDTPCEGGALHLYCHPDSVGPSYSWQLMGGSWTSTLENPIISPVTFADTGTYRVIRTSSGGAVIDTATIHVFIYPKPTDAILTNAPLCVGMGDTLVLAASLATAGDLYAWTGPGGFTSTLHNFTIYPFTFADTGIFTLIVTTMHGCKDTSNVDATMLPIPPAPIISGQTNYCLGDAPTPFVVTGLVSGGIPKWYATATGGVGSTTYPTVNTSVLGCTTFYASQVNPCEGPRDSITVCVHPHPVVPYCSNNSPICADSLLELFDTVNTLGITYSWSGPSGFSSTLKNPTIPNAQTPANAGTYALTVTDTVYGCKSSSTTNVIINYTPVPPVLTADSPCNGFTLNLTALSNSGVTYYWSGPSSYTSTVQNPDITPAVLGINDGVYTVYAVSPAGCPSLTDTVLAVIHPNPPAPIVNDTSYCQKAPSYSLLAYPDSGTTNVIRWYNTIVGGTGSTVAPIPNTSVVGTTTWYVDQTTQYGCVSPRTPQTATILFLPEPVITPSKSFACQDSTLVLSYTGVAMTEPSYLWTLPWYLHGCSIVSGSLTTPSVTVRFDSTFGNWVYLRAFDYSGRCWADDTLFIKVVPIPHTNLYIYPHICAGDTVAVALTTRDTSAYNFEWDFDNGTIVTANSNSGGPYGISWLDWGTKIIKVTPYTIEGCVGNTMYDTINVRQKPDARFHIEGSTRSDTVLCREDSTRFVAEIGDSTNFSYEWKPSHFFHQNNKGTIWGRIEVSADVTLEVTNEWGCREEESHHYDPENCCVIKFPTAFTPNGDGRNDKFRPIHQGYHRFHVFRIQNRWGQTVYETTNSDGDWDGTYGGEPQDIGTYFYYLSYDCGGKTLEIRGDVTLVR